MTCNYYILSISIFISFLFDFYSVCVVFVVVVVNEMGIGTQIQYTRVYNLIN